MKRNNFSFMAKQTAVIVLCGLLPIVVRGQQRSKVEVERIVSDFCLGHTKTAGKEMTIKGFSSKNFPATAQLSNGEAFYIYTAKDAKGFVIVSGDRRMPSILGYSETNSFDVNNIPPNVQYWLWTFAEAYSLLNEANEDSSAIAVYEAGNSGVNPLLGGIQWAQDEPYNLLCPVYNRQRSVTGCVATAMAQVMKYYEYPAIGTGHPDYYTSTHHLHVTKDLSKKEFQWDLMLDSYAGSYTREEGYAVAELMYSCGASVEMDYSPDESGAYQHDLVTAYINNFHYDSDAAILFREYCTTSEWHSLLIKELDEGRPVNYAGSSGPNGGHSFVIDGYRLSSATYPDYHVNWGWGGSFDGYYQLVSLRPSGHVSGFSNGQQMTIGIKPDDGVAESRRWLSTTALKASATKARRGEQITISASSLCNFSYKDFSGEIAVALFDKVSGELMGLTSHRLRRLTFMDELDNVQYALQVPDDISDGEYLVKMLSKSSIATEWSPVYSAKYPSVSVISNDIEMPQDSSPTILACSDLEMQRGSDDQTIKIRLYQLTNWCLEPFDGTLTILLTDTNNNIMLPLSPSVKTGEIGYMQIQLNSILLEGGINDNLPDGRYHLFIGTRQKDTDKYSFLKQYDPTLPYIEEPSELKFNVVKEGSQITIGDHTFECRPTRINDVLHPSENSIITYTIDGKRINSPQRGINILRLSDGTTCKVMVK